MAIRWDNKAAFSNSILVFIKYPSKRIYTIREVNEKGKARIALLAVLPVAFASW